MGKRRLIVTLSLLCFLQLKQRLLDIASFRFSKSLYSRSVLCKRTNNFGPVFPNRLDRRNYETKFRIHASFLFSVVYLSCNFKFFFDAQNFRFIHECSHAITLPVSVNCRNSNVEGNITHKINYRHYGHFLGPEFYVYPEREGGLSSQGRGDG